GQAAVVRTVFTGHRIESFDAEIIGVLDIGRTEGQMILARATSERVIKSGVAQGMSGSPVYVNGKLIGALSSGWNFESEPIFGITPIGEMLSVLDWPMIGGSGASSGPSGVEPDSPGGASPRCGPFRWPGDDDDSPDEAPVAIREPAADAAPLLTGRLTTLPLPLACGGLHPGMFDRARELLAPFGLSVVPGGQSRSASSDTTFEPGSAVAVDMMRGDLQMAAIGTVTYRDGDRVLIFGHPFFQAGAVRMPLATAEIISIIPSSLSSFKLGVRGREVGVALQDRRPAVAGVMNGRAEMLPMTVSVRMGQVRNQVFHFEVVEDRGMAPTLVAIAALNCILESGGAGSGQTVEWTIRLVRHGAPPLVLHDVAAGEAAFGGLLSAIGGPLRFLMNNPFQRLALDSVVVTSEVRPTREQWTLRSARLQSRSVRPGGQAVVMCELQHWRGARITRSLTIDVPEEAPPGRYALWVGGGAELMRFESIRTPAAFRPTSLDDAWRRLGRTHPADALYGGLYASAPQITADGRDYPELPESAAMLMSGGTATPDRRRSETATLDLARLPLGGAVDGSLLLDLTVDDRAP
ncbi:MAG: SpoIVB peptidase S55 domain-containing protein, partial [Candidatus Eiseniibacteriota bacterium]